MAASRVSTGFSGRKLFRKKQMFHHEKGKMRLTPRKSKACEPSGSVWTKVQNKRAILILAWTSLEKKTNKKTQLQEWMMALCLCAFDANLRWLFAMGPSSAEPLHDGSRLGGIVLSLRKPSNLCKQYRWPKKQKKEKKRKRMTHINSDGNEDGQTDGERQTKGVK